MTDAYQLRKRDRDDGSGVAQTYILMANTDIIEALQVASILSGKLCETLDVMRLTSLTEPDEYVVTYCGGSLYWWLPGTDGRDMHQLGSYGWCWDCYNGGENGREAPTFTHHLSAGRERDVLMAEHALDKELRKRVEGMGLTAETYARNCAQGKYDHDQCEDA